VVKKEENSPTVFDNLRVDLIKTESAKEIL